LADISELDRSDEVLISTEEQDTFRVINNHLNDANKAEEYTGKANLGHNEIRTLLSNPQDRGRKTTRRRGHEEPPFCSLSTIPTVVN
jgi:hypothetical protein